MNACFINVSNPRGMYLCIRFYLLGKVQKMMSRLIGSNQQAAY